MSTPPVHHIAQHLVCTCLTSPHSPHRLLITSPCHRSSPAKSSDCLPAPSTGHTAILFCAERPQHSPAMPPHVDPCEPAGCWRWCADATLVMRLTPTCPYVNRGNRPSRPRHAAALPQHTAHSREATAWWTSARSQQGSTQGEPSPEQGRCSIRGTRASPRSAAIGHEVPPAVGGTRQRQGPLMDVSRVHTPPHPHTGHHRPLRRDTHRCVALRVSYHPPIVREPSLAVDSGASGQPSGSSMWCTRTSVVQVQCRTSTMPTT